MAISTSIVKSFQLTALSTALALAGCGGGGGGGHNDTLMPKIPKASMTSVTNDSTSNNNNVVQNLANVKKVQLFSAQSLFSLVNDSQLELTVYALDDNNLGVAGVPVNIAITDPAVTGVYSSTVQNLTTDATGKATITLDVRALSGDQRNYLKDKGLEVRATIGNLTTSKTLKGTDNATVTTPSDNVKDILLISDSQNIALEKGSKIELTAIALDGDNNFIPNTAVNFNISNSVLTGVFANSNLTVATNEKGEAKLELEVKSLTAEQAQYLKQNGLVITSKAQGNGVQSNSITLKGIEPSTNSSVQRLDVQAINLISSVNPFTVQQGEKFTITAVVLNSSNTGFGGVPVQFELLDNPADTGIYAVSDTTNVVTNAQGQATFELEVKSTAALQRLVEQGVRVKASAQNTTGATPVVKDSVLTVLGQEPLNTPQTNVNKVANVLLSGSVSEIDLTAGNTFTVVANVGDINRGALSNVPVTFSIPDLEQTGIANLTGSTVKTDEQGQAAIKLEIKSLSQAQRDYLVKNGFIINANVPNGTSVTPLVIKTKPVETPKTVSNISVTSDSTNILMAKGVKVKVTAIALDENFGGIANQELRVSMPDPAITGVYNITGSTVKTNEKGEAVIDLEIKSDLTNAQKDTLRDGLTITVNSTNGKTGQLTLKGQATNAETVDRLTLTANVSNIPLKLGEQFTVTANVADANNGSIEGVPVVFNLPSLAEYGVASLSPASVATNAQGQAVITLQVQSLTDEQRANLLKGFAINATANGKQAPTLTLQGVDNTTQRFDVRRVILNKAFDKYTIKVGEKFTITASVLNPSNEPIAGVPVSFSVPNPSNTGLYAVSNISNVTTNARGEATIELEVKSEAHKQALINGVNFYATAKNTASATPSDVRSTALTVQGVDPTPVAQQPNSAKVASALLSSSINQLDLTTGTKFSVTANIADANRGALRDVPVTFSIPGLEQTGIANLTGSTVITNEQGQATIELEIKSLNQAQRDYLLNNGFVVNASVPNGTRVNPITISTNPPAIEQNVNSVSVTADSNTILMAAGSRVKVTAIALDSNFGGMANQALTFNITDPALTGVFNTTGSTINTNARGEAIIELEVKSALSAEQKRALAEGVTVEVVSTNGKTGSIVITGQPVSETVVGNVALTSNVTNIPLTVGSQFTITATALDPQNGALANIPVTFNLPSFDDYGVASLSPSTVTTNEQGQAVITLQVQSLTDEQRANLLKGFAINATANGKQAPTLTLQGVDNTTQRFDVQRVRLTSPANAFNVKVGERFTVTASVLNGNNIGIGGVPVSFNLVDDPAITGVYVVSDASNVTTNANGEATVELEVKSEAAKAYLLQNGARLTATAKNTAANPTRDVTGSIAVRAADPAAAATNPNIAKVTSGVLSSNVAEFDMLPGSKITVTASVADANGGALSGVPVTFSLPSLDQTGFVNLTGSTVTTNSQGQATITVELKKLDAAQRTYLQQNGLKIAANVPNGAAIAPITLGVKDTVVAKEVQNVTVTADSNTILMVAGSKVTVTAVALDDNFGGMKDVDLSFNIPNPQLTGVFNITGSTVGTGSTVRTDERGEAKIELEIKSQLTEAQKQQLQNGLTITVTAPNGKQGIFTLKGQGANETKVNALTLVSDISRIPLTIGSEFTVTALVVDANNGQVTDGVPVTFNLPSLAESGLISLSPSTVRTQNGQASIKLRVQSLTEAQRTALQNGITINATANGQQTALTLQAQPQPSVTVNSVALITDTNTISTDGNETINVTAILRDTANNALANVPVSFVIDDTNATGIFAASPQNNVLTNANGEATLQLQSRALTDEQRIYLQTMGLTVRVNAGDKTAQTTLRAPMTDASNQAATLMLRSEFNNIAMNVGNKVKLTAVVLDQNSAIVPNASVSFNVPTDSGLINNTGAVVKTGADGRATIELEVTQVTEMLRNGVTITAQSGNARMTTVLRGATNNSSTQAYELFVTQSKERLNTASDTMTLGVRVLDTRGGVKANVPVYLQLLDDGVRQGLSFDANSALRTNENGYVEFNLRQSDVGLVAKLDHTARVRVMVNDGVFRTEEQTLEIPVTGTAVRNVLASKTSVTDNETISISGQLVDGGGRAITNTRVTLLNNNQPLAIPIAANTDNAGNFRVSVNTAALGAAANGTYPLSVRVEGTDRNNQRISQDFSLVTLTQVDPNRLSLRLQQNGVDVVNNELAAGSAGDVVVNLPNDIPVGSMVYLSTDRGTFGNGQSRLGVTVPESRQVTFGGLRSDAPGTARLTLTHNDNTLLNSTVSFISNDVQKLLLQVTNSTVSVNGETNVIATVRDSNDAPIKNALVEFSIVADPSSGRLSSATALTNDSGVAQINYFAGGIPTPVNGVEIRAAVNQVRIGNEYTNVTRPQVASQRLTVQSMATYIGFAFADKLQVSADNIYYLQDGSIFVNNSVGQPAANQEVSIAVVPETYTLGLWRVIPRVPEVPEVRDDNGNVTTPAVPEQPARWEQSYFNNTSGSSVQITGSASCLNEDSNGNGILDAGEDYNGDGQLTPINPITVLSRDGQQLGNNQTIRTDSAGKLDFTIRYPKEYAQWMTATVWVTTRVDGSEFRGQRTISLPLVQDDVTLDQTNSTGTRPNTISPFGTLVTANMASFCRPNN